MSININPHSQALWQVAQANAKPKPAIELVYFPHCLCRHKKTKSFKKNKLKKYPLISKKDRNERHQKIYRNEAILKVKNLSFSYYEKLILSKF